MATGGEKCMAEFLAVGVIGIVGAVVRWLYAASKKAVRGKSTTPEQEKQLQQFGDLDKFRQEHKGEGVSDDKTRNN